MAHRTYHHTLFDYTILCVLFLICFFSFLKISGHAGKQMEIALITASSYGLWGIFHHLHEGDLHWKIVVEYAAFALFGFIALSVVLMVFV